MSVARLSRSSKRQLGQYFTPADVAQTIVEGLDIDLEDRVLEPSFGTGAFLFAAINTVASRCGSEEAILWAKNNLYGCEIDETAANEFACEWERRGLGEVSPNFERRDFFKWLPRHLNDHRTMDKAYYKEGRLESFDIVIGNPPFGGSFDPKIQDKLDEVFGNRLGNKIKKETYAFFIVKCVDLLKEGGKLCFICSDTILTIPTMRGLRYWLNSTCTVDIEKVPGEFRDTNQEMLLLRLTKKPKPRDSIKVFGERVGLQDISITPNYSWRVNGEYSKYFRGPLVGSKLIASSGMTTGNNNLFVRKIIDGRIKEPYEFSLIREPITLEKELARTRTGRLSERKLAKIRLCEVAGEKETVLKYSERLLPEDIDIPHEDYRYYNKATRGLIYTKPGWVIFWREKGRYVYTYKKTGNWYLHGVGGRPFFGREGLTWNLIAARINTRWLPAGYILDSGAPCAFLRDGVNRDELFFIMGWTLTDLCNDILKSVLNHTRNIQSKDFERLPYPYWVAERERRAAIASVKSLISEARSGTLFDHNSRGVRSLGDYYRLGDGMQLST